MLLRPAIVPFAALLLQLVAHPGAAQQQAQYSQYMNNNYVLNPGVAGTEDFIDLKFSHRRQWAGLDGAPQTYYASAHSALNRGNLGRKGKPLRNHDAGFHAVGGLVYRDVTGPTSRTSLYASYAYNLALSRQVRVALGVALGAQQFAINGAALDFHDAGEPLGSVSALVPDATVGVWVYTPTIYLGASASQLLGNQLDFSYARLGTTAADNRLQRHYYLTGGVRLPLGRDLTLVPSVLVKSVRTAPVSVDFNAKLKYQDVFWLGASFRSFDSFAVLAGVSVTQTLTVGYAYDSGVSALRDYNVGSHEVLLGLRLTSKQTCPQRFW